MSTYSKRDLSLVPFMAFSFVESYIKSHKVSSGGKVLPEDLCMSWNHSYMTCKVS